jgi:hypothetical protein
MDIGNLKGITSDEVSKLRRPEIGVESIEILWERVGQDLNDGITNLARDTGIPAERLCSLLITEALADEGTRLSQRWLDIVLVIGPIILLALAVRAYVPFPWWPARVQQVVVGAADLPAFHLIGGADVIVKRAPAEPGTFAALSDVLGRYPLRPVPAGATLRTDQVSTIKVSPSDLAGLDLLSVPISRDRLTAAAVPGARVSLLFSPREAAPGGPQPLILNNLLVLALEPRGDTVALTVATRRDDAQRAAALYGTSDVVVLQPAS